MEAEQAKIAKAYRYENRKSIDELLRKLLNGDLFDIFSQSKQDYIPQRKNDNSVCSFSYIYTYIFL